MKGKLGVWVTRGAYVAAGLGGSLVVSGVCLALPPDITTYTAAVADIMDGVSGAIPTMIGGLAAVICGLAAVRIGIGFVRRFAK